MTKKPLQTLFDAMYHDKQNFENFATSPMRTHVDEKNFTDKSGKTRAIIVPDKTLKKYHSFLNLFIFNHLPVNEKVVFSYRKGTNVADAVRKHSASRHFYQADLSNFFGSITSQLVTQAILRSQELIPVADLSKYIDRIVNLVTFDGRLPLGFSTSPIISNAVLLPFDEQLDTYCSSRGLIYTRYSDDITISSEEKSPLLNLGDVINDFLSLDFSELKLNKEKTKYSSKGSKIKILGMVILPNGQVSLDSKIKNKTETLLHLYTNNQKGLTNATHSDLEESYEQLSGLLNYANTVDQNYLDKLRRKYGTTVVDILIHQPKKSESKKKDK